MRIIFFMSILLSLTMAKTTIVNDPRTSLMWEDTIHSKDNKLNQPDAVKYCKSLELGSFQNWRMPTMSELISIVDYTKFDPAILKEFHNIDNDTLYWSSSAYVGSKNDFWGVIFEDGTLSKAYQKYIRYIRCVRDTK